MKQKTGSHAYENIMKNPAAYMNRPEVFPGRYDPVYRLWEDPFFRSGLFQFLNISGNTHFTEKELNILDLGCGTGKGIELLSGLFRIGSCTGIDLSQSMVSTAASLYSWNSNYRFLVHDLRDPLPESVMNPSVDLIVSTYGTLSHLEDQELGALTDSILSSAGDSVILAADVLGRYSPEWPDYWDGPAMQDYCMSHLTPPGERTPGKAERFPMRFWGASELADTLKRSAARNGYTLSFLHMKDRSIVTGRHMDTQEFYKEAKPVRSVMNSLLSQDSLTDLRRLTLPPLIPEKNRSHHPEIYSYLENFRNNWNERAGQILQALTPASSHESKYHDLFSHLLEIRVPDSVSSVIEPVIGFLLLQLEEELNKGLGCGHSLVFYAQFSKDNE